MERKISGIALSILHPERFFTAFRMTYLLRVYFYVPVRRKSLLWCGDGVSDYTGNIFNTRVARVSAVGVGRGCIGRVAVCGMCWRIVCNPEWSERSRG